MDAAVEKVKEQLDKLAPGFARERDAELSEARALAAKQFEQIEVLHRHSLIERRPQWYFGPTVGDRHWPALRAYLTDVKRWPENDVAAIDDASNEVVSLLENPAKPQFSCRGLVVGHVQSGKTANMTAVMAKALDAGYNTVIVLAGLTNKLRYQTQTRLFTDLVSRHRAHDRWQVLTSNSIDRDFRAPAEGGFLSHTDKAQLAVIKKNVSPLRELKRAVAGTVPLALSRLRILVIDDECDQASVNSARGELEMTAINQRIRGLLASLPAVSYIGYTATPFANVLTNPYRTDGQDLDDLYPRDFITALPRPATYFGAEQLFGREPSSPDDVQPQEDGLDMIREIREEDVALLQPAGRRAVDGFHPAMVESLEIAMAYFLCCCAVRRARGDEDKHMTMLVHTSVYVTMHERLAALINGWKDRYRSVLLDPTSDLSQRMEDVWSSEQRPEFSDITEARTVDFKEIRRHLPEVLDVVEVAVENGSSEDRIDYSGQPRTYIVVGGSILARGLTLEGLMVSYFLRSSSQYDTLLQMGRWFGYRKGYEDLPRIWTTEELKLKFRALAAIEQEIRQDIEQYTLQNLTPMDAAIRIRAIPGMAITGANKMRGARKCAISFWGEHRQTFRFNYQDEAWLMRNWVAGAELVSQAEELKCRDQATDRKLWREVPKSTIVRFFETYEAHESHADLARDFLLNFLRSSDDRLDRWNVGVVEPRRGRVSGRGLGTVGKVRLVTRARLNDAGTVADIKALMSRTDVMFDSPESARGDSSWAQLKTARRDNVGQVPLLLLYAIDRESPPRSHVRVSLDAADDVLGYGIVFPGSVTEGEEFVSVELQPLSADELDDLEAEEAAQARAAGVD